MYTIQKTEQVNHQDTINEGVTEACEQLEAKIEDLETKIVSQVFGVDWLDVLKFCDETLLQEQVTTLTQANARWQRHLDKTVVQQNGVTGGSQANA